MSTIASPAATGQRFLLIHGDGTCELGPIDDVVNADSLARLYAHPLREIRDGDHRWFIPA